MASGAFLDWYNGSSGPRLHFFPLCHASDDCVPTGLFSPYGPAMKVFVTGAEGLLGRAVVLEAEERGSSVVAAPRVELDVTDERACLRALVDAGAHVVVHCAAFTDVDAAETAEARALAVNRDGTGNVARAALEAGSLLVYPSTDYVFDGAGDHPYSTLDPPNPIGAYGRSKLHGEDQVRRSGVPHLVVRTSWLYGEGGRNFVDTILRHAREREELRVVADQIGRPTWSRSLAATLLDLLDKGATGTLNVCDSGTASWFDLAKSTLEIAGLPTRLIPVTSSEWGAPAPRPPYSVLDLRDTEALLGRNLSHWMVSLETYLGEIL